MRHLVPLLTVSMLFLTGCNSGAGDAVAPAPATTGPSATEPTTPEPTTPEPTTPAPTSPAPTSDPTAATTPPTPAATSPTQEPGAATSQPVPFPADTRDDVSEGGGDLVTVTDVRIARHDGFDRLVLDLGGDGTAGWVVGYDDDPRHQGSGDPVDVSGGAVLHVALSHTGYPTDTGIDEYDGPRRQDGAVVVTEVLYGGIFEGTTELFVGVAGTQPFRVFGLEGRVVIDVWHADVGD